MRTEYYLVRMPPDMPYEIRAELNSWYVESEPIVRCADCRFRGVSSWGVENPPICKRPTHPFVISLGGFCAWGKRRAEQ